MNINDIFWLGYSELKEKKVRTALTVIMVVIGVGAIIALISQTAGVSASIKSSLSSLGPTSILVTSTRGSGFTDADTADISSLPNVSTVIPVLTGQGDLLTDGQNISVTVIGISPEDLKSATGGSLSIYSGSMYNDTVAPISVISYDTAFESTGKQVGFVGQPATLVIQGSSYGISVVGILNSYSSFVVPESSVFMPVGAAEELLHKTSFNEIIVEANSTKSVSAVATMISDIYGNNARVLSTQQLTSEVSSVIGSISILLVIIAGVSLLVAAIGIMNVMLMAVLERTHEIGIMKSLGFKNRDVMLVFLIQSLLIGFIGGIIGIAAGTAASYGLSAAVSHSPSANTTSTSGAGAPTTAVRGGGAGGAGFVGGGAGGTSTTSISYSPVVTPAVIAEALLVAIGVSTIAGIYPAWRASKMEPIEALREL